MAGMMEYKCPCCGGSVEFNTSVQKMKCPYCDTEFDIETLKEYEAQKSTTEDNMEWNREDESTWDESEEEHINLYVCSSCGGELIADENTAATSCPYCGNPIVMTERVTGNLRPKYIIPFKLDKKAAKEGLKKHVSGKKLLPKIFKSENHIDEIKGIYVPFWIFDAEADAYIRYRGEIINVWSDSEYDYTETSHYSIVRGGNIDFVHVPVDGSSKMADDLMESIEPFDFSEAVNFESAYLAGFLADKYDISCDESIERANERIKRSTENAFRNTINNYSNVIVESSNINLNNGHVTYVLYPVWILNTTWRNKKYTFAMNGQTGKFVGNMPTDYGIFWTYFAVLTIVLSALIYAIMWFFL